MTLIGFGKMAWWLAIIGLGIVIALTESTGRADSASTTQGGTVPTMGPATSPSAESSTDLEMARAALSQNNLPLAIEYVSRQLDRAPGNGESLALLRTCVRQRATDECGRSEQIEAKALVSELSTRVQAARQSRFQPDAPATALDDLVARDRDIQEIGNSITASADEQAAPHIDAAMGLAREAHYHWYTFCSNDRNKVREALRELRWVHDRGPALSKDAIGRYCQALDQLKTLVADSEWAPLLAEAGYAQMEAGQ